MSLHICQCIWDFEKGVVILESLCCLINQIQIFDDAFDIFLKVCKKLGWR